MYREIYDYAVKNHLVSIPNTALKIIAAYINLDKDGEYIGLDIIDKKARKKVICPDTGSLAFAGGNANPIVEKSSFIFDKEQKKHLGWISIMADGADNVEIMAPIYRFSLKCDEDKNFSDEIYKTLQDGKVKPSDFISFRVNGEKAEDNDAWHEWIAKYIAAHSSGSSEDIPKIVSSISGRVVTSIAKKTAPAVKASVTGTGAYIAAIGSCPSFESYGLDGNIGASIGQDEAESIKAGLEYLLRDGTHYNSKFEIIHWFEDEQVEDLINESLNLNDSNDDDDDDDSYNDISKEADKSFSKLLNCAITGEVPDRLPDTKYYLTRFSVPTKGREFLADGHIGTYSSLYKNLEQWYRDSEVIKTFFNKELKTYTTSKRILKNIYGILFDLMSESDKTSKEKFKKLDATFGTAKYELLKCVYDGAQMPRIFLLRAIDMYSKAIISRKKPSIKQIQVIQIYMKRLVKKEGDMDEYNKTKAYACGRLFAVYERAQNLASGNVSVNVTQKYFAAVQKAPQLFFPKLANLSIVYLRKIKKDSTRIWLDKMIGNIATQIGDSFPDKFTDIEKGQFILGYYNQKNELFISDNANLAKE